MENAFDMGVMASFAVFSVNSSAPAIIVVSSCVKSPPFPACMYTHYSITRLKSSKGKAVICMLDHGDQNIGLDIETIVKLEKSACPSITAEKSLSNLFFVTIGCILLCSRMTTANEGSNS